ncbi:MAG: hypothetical protein CL811_05725 [Colwelliaceae bacterium]|nr:hypothetical protein [Colwelliaceae bacterium]
MAGQKARPFKDKQEQGSSKRAADAQGHSDNTGVEGTHSFYQTFKITTFKNQKVLEHPDNPSGVVFGNDIFYRDGKGAPAATISIYNISEQADPKEDVDLRDKGSYQFSSRLDISNMTDIEAPTVKAGSFDSRSAIEGRADVVSLKGTEFVQIRAGGARYNSRGKKINAPGEIHIVSIGQGKAQPVVLGKNFIQFAKSLTERVEDLTSTLQKMHTEILSLKAALVTHIHISAFPVSPSPDLLAGIVAGSVNDCVTMCNTFAETSNNIFGKMNHLEPASKKYLLSKTVKVN